MWSLWSELPKINAWAHRVEITDKSWLFQGKKKKTPKNKQTKKPLLCWFTGLWKCHTRSDQVPSGTHLYWRNPDSRTAAVSPGVPGDLLVPVLPSQWQGRTLRRMKALGYHWAGLCPTLSLPQLWTSHCGHGSDNASPMCLVWGW